MIITKEVKKLIKNEYCDDIDWKYHLESVHKFALELASKIKCDNEIVELAALLHDIGRYVTKEQEGHEKTGLPEARKVLERYNYPENKIQSVLHCVESHRGSVDVKTKTIEAEIVRNADAMAHYDIMPLFFVMCGDNDKKIVEKATWAKQKYERNWSKKLTLPEAKEVVREKHKAIMLILDSILSL
jgi:putative nucleotidyltransferase with HDIG domain